MSLSRLDYSVLNGYSHFTHHSLVSFILIVVIWSLICLCVWIWFISFAQKYIMLVLTCRLSSYVLFSLYSRRDVHDGTEVTLTISK
jgi:hypothetical protein